MDIFFQGQQELPLKSLLPHSYKGSVDVVRGCGGDMK